ncbi:MAG: radical SAM protein [Planctomycetes bacterium]|nr:radical SAM protein [Planctomycetota bacterium]
MDGALLLFDRESGLCALCDGPETAALRQSAPRVVQFSITNQCNLACSFCYRPLKAQSGWTVDSAFELLSELSAAGVLEVAFGGGEPWVFPGFEVLVRRLHDETRLAVNLTTNGMGLTPARLRAIEGSYGQIRLSLYDENGWPERVAMLARAGARFGVNWLVTPARLPELEAMLLRLAALGCRDVLLLSYNGADQALHLSAAQSAELGRRVAVVARALEGRLQLKLSVCWGDRLDSAPRLLPGRDCGAGMDFVVLTSERKLQPCSFHQLGFPIESASDVLAHWRAKRADLASPARIIGCARKSDYGFVHGA